MVRPHPHSPLPWRTEQPKHDPQAWDVVAAAGGVVDKLPWFGGKENAAYIVHACNAYPKLVQALLETQCACTPRERLSGHRADCSRADIDAILRELGENE